MTERKPFVFKFEDIVVRENEFAFTRAGETVNVEPTAFRVLLYLLRNPGRLVTKDEIMAAVWHHTAVSDNSLTRSIATLRRVLDDSSREPRYIATAQTLGYRFLCSVEVHEDGVGGVGLSVPVGITEDAGRRTGGGVEPRSGQTDLPGTEPDGGAKKRVRRFTMIVAGAAVVTAVLVAMWVVRERLFPRPQMREEQLTRNSNDNPVIDAAISGDGKYLAFSDIAGVHVRLLHTGETADISTPPELRNSVVTWRVYWLPDSTRFLAVADLEGGAPSTWEASVVGGTLRKIRENAAALSVSPDGSTVAYKSPDQHEVWLVGIHGETPHKLFDTGKSGLVGNVVWSPDGRRLLYGLFDWSGGRPGIIRMESRDFKGDPPVTLLSDSQLRNISWLSGGRVVYVLHEGDENSDTCNYWLARMDFKTGRFAGEPKQLTHGVGYCMASTSATADGKRLVFLKQSNQSSVYVASLGPGAASITPPVHFTMTQAQEIPAAWSVDSQSVIFVSNRDHAWGFYRQPLGGGPPTPIVAGITYAFPRVSPDGKWLLWEVIPKVYHPGDKVDVMRVPMEGGTPQLIFSEPNIIDILRCAQFPATLCAICTVTPDLSHLVFTSFDPLSGRGHELMRVDIDRGSDNTWALSPDGNRIALLKRATAPAQIRILSLTTRTEVRFTVKDRSNLFSLDWTADGKGLFTSTIQPGILLHLDLEGHADVLWEPKGTYMPWAVPSPDGRYVAMPFWGQESNAWMLEDF